VDCIHYFHFVLFFCFSDINECLASARVCGENEVCHDKEDGYECRCKKGFTREKDICVRKYIFQFIGQSK
jgi:hypothetical protein